MDHDRTDQAREGRREEDADEDRRRLRPARKNRLILLLCHDGSAFQVGFLLVIVLSTNGTPQRSAILVSHCRLFGSDVPLINWHASITIGLPSARYIKE